MRPSFFPASGPERRSAVEIYSAAGIRKACAFLYGRNSYIQSAPVSCLARCTQITVSFPEAGQASQLSLESRMRLIQTIRRYLNKLVARLTRLAFPGQGREQLATSDATEVNCGGFLDPAIESVSN